MKTKDFKKLSSTLKILFILVLLAVGVYAGTLIAPALGKEVQVVESMKKESNIELLALSVTDIYPKTEPGKLFGHSLPLSDETKFLRGEFQVHLGMNGKNVKISQSFTNPHHYIITIPTFEALSVSNPQFETVDTQNDILSFGEKIDTNKMEDSALSPKTLKKYVKDNIPFLKDQTKNYYTQLAKAFDSKAELTFKFKD